MTEERALLRMTEAAQRLGIGKTKAYDLAKAGKLPGVVRVGGTLRVSARHLDTWIDQQVADPKPAA